MKLYIDRIENNIAICFDENENIIKIKTKKILGKICEGCVLRRSDAGFVVDEIATKLKRQEIFKLQDAVFGDDEIY